MTGRVPSLSTAILTGMKVGSGMTSILTGMTIARHAKLVLSSLIKIRK